MIVHFADLRICALIITFDTITARFSFYAMLCNSYPLDRLVDRYNFGNERRAEKRNKRTRDSCDIKLRREGTKH